MSEGWMRGGHAAVGMLSALLLFPAPIHAEGARPNSGGAGPGPSPSASGDEVIRQGTAVPGSRVAIGPDGPIPPGTTFRWVQVEGPTVPLDDPTAAKIRFVV